MILVTTNHLPGREVSEVFGSVRGNSVRARGIGYDIIALTRPVFGGAIPEYAKSITTTREKVTHKMVSDAKGLGVDAVLALRHTTSMVGSGPSEILAYGTAVKLR